ncbi:MAG: hypothetical protein SGI73_15135 [Chloroflexota bacterium]|nr:hypothetical protein [Chloroflexota bacterium]
MSARYLNPIKWLGGIALIAVVFGIIFPAIRDAIQNERLRSGVLLQAMPFFAFFVAVLMTFILLIVLAARRYGGVVPRRTYNGIEWTLIAGIVFGVIFLFQPFSFVPYRYGFLLLLVSLLSFILWSHVPLRGAKTERRIAPFAASHQIVGLVVAAIAAAIIAALILTAAAPQPPYGVRDRVWNSYDDARKAETAAAAAVEFNNAEVPFVIVLSLFPAALFFFISREIAASRSVQPQPKS